MRLSALFGLASLAAAVSASSLGRQARPIRHDHRTHDYYVLHLDNDTPPDQIALHLGLVHEGPLGELPGHHIFSTGKTDDDVVKRELQQRRRRRADLHDLHDRSPLDGVLFAQKQVARRRLEKRVVLPRIGPSLGPGQGHSLSVLQGRANSKEQDEAVQRLAAVADELSIVDPIFKEQWHLFNTVQLGHDVNVTDVWRNGITGKNTTVAIVDDGLDMDSDDLKDNYYAKGSYDFNDHSPDPKPRLSDDHHGTRCAGEVSAVRNDVCGVGVAYESKIAGLRILSKAISDAEEAQALNYDFHNNQIYSCSWGPPDDGRSMDAPGILIRRAMLNAVQKGRNGLGSIYVFASGNGAASDDNCNFDGYTNSIYSITVGALDRAGEHPYYSEKCSASLVVTYSSGGGDAIHTTDVGQNSCYNNHGGTSAAAPLAAGIFALALQVRPDLTWRDMQYLVMLTAVPVQPDHDDWQTTFIGKKYSHTFAYGKVDSYALVEAAKSWVNVKPQAWYFTPWIHVHQDIPQGDVGLSVTVEITEAMLREANFARIEHVTVTMNIEHTRRGDLSVDLISPNNIVSHLSATRKPDNVAEGYVDWTFMSVVHWGESGVGNWTVLVKDTVVNDKNGSFTDFHVKLWGESIDASKAKLLPMPNETDDDDHDLTSTTTLPASTTTLAPTATAPADAAPTTVNASDHPDRPTKPTGGSAESSTAPAPTGTSTETETETTSEPSPTSTDGNNTVSWLPAFLGNLSTKKQIWIYGALGFIGAFCIGLGVYLYMARRRRLRNSTRDNYEFELLDDDELEGLNGGDSDDDDDDGQGGGGGGGGGLGRRHSEKTALDGSGGNGGGGGNGNGRRRKATRGGELYDAFASDDEDEEEEEDDEGSGVGGSSSSAGDSESYGRAAQTGGMRGVRGGRGSGSNTSSDASPARHDADHHVIGDDSDEDSDEEEHGNPHRPSGRDRLL